MPTVIVTKQVFWKVNFDSAFPNQIATPVIWRSLNVFQ